MALSGLDSDAALEHDIVESWRHGVDKEALEKRKLGDWVFVQRSLEYEFKNDFSAIGPREALYFQGAGIPTVTVSSIDPEPWDESGTMASFSAGSGAAVLREFFRQQGRRARGRKAAGAAANRELPHPPSGSSMAPPTLKRVGPLEHLEWLREIRDDSRCYHRWGTGADLRLQWKPTPASTRTTSIEGDAAPGMIDESINAIKSGSTSKPGERTIREVREGSDLRRYTVNTHPALARALAKMVAAGEKERVIAIMGELAPRVAAKFQEVTGRRCVALSVHFDSNLPHWNIWHCGTEQVIYPIGNKLRKRNRRTAFDLNSSGSLLAWHRTRLAFERLGKDFKALSSRTVNELEKGLRRAMERQDRPPGDWTINEEADRLLEDALRMSGKGTEIEAGFAEFIENEERRYRDGGAGREPKDGRKLAVLLHDDESVVDAINRLKQADEIPAIEEQLKPGVGETLADAAARVVTNNDALNSKTMGNATELVRLNAERDRLSTERDKFKNEADQSGDFLERIQATLGIKNNAEIVPTLGRVVGEANQVPDLKRQIDVLNDNLGLAQTSLRTEQEKVKELEREIGPLRRLKELCMELIPRLIEPKFYANLTKGMIKHLTEIATIVGIKIDISDQKMK